MTGARDRARWSRARAAGAVAALLTLAAACREASVHTQIVPGGDATRGRQYIASYGCGGCHVVPGVPGAKGRVGPPLEHFGERAYIAGALRNEPAALVRWIMDPQTIEPGTAMPDLGVSEQIARDMAAYLYSRTGGALGPPYLIPANVLPEH